MDKKKKMLKKATTLALGAGLVTSGLSAFNPSSPTPVHAATNPTAVQILSKLTAAQRQALQKLTANDQSGLFLDPKVKLGSTANVSVIVQFKNKPEKTAVLEAAVNGRNLTSTQAKSKANGDHELFKQDLAEVFKQKQDGTFKLKREYKYAFNGVALTLPANKIQEIMKSKAVQAIYSNNKIMADPPVKIKDAMPSSEPQGQGMAAENAYLNINKLHKEGYTGKGVKIAVIDTGVDYNHPDIKAAFKGGYDFVDNDANPMETTYQDYLNYKKVNPTTTLKASDYETEHGTHVSGTIVGQGKNNSPYATNGIAPDASLYVYRVLGPGGSGSDESVMAGIDKAVADGVDVMNLSLGANYNDPFYPTSIAINNAVLTGVTAVIAAGNSGDGMYTLGSPGSAQLALTVGASDVPQVIPTMKGNLDSVSSSMRGLAKGWNDDFASSQGKTLPIVAVPNYGAVNDYLNINVAGKVALVQRGNNQSINDKILQAKLKGAAAILIWNNNPTEGYMPFYLGEGTDFIPAFNLTNADGLALKAKIASGMTQFSFANLSSYKTSGDNLASFSSRGPSRTTYDIKPEVTAPGVNVLSTVPGFVHTPDNPSDYSTAYERMSGTSMATPNVTGIAALLLQAKPNLNPEDIKTILMNTAVPLNGTYSVFEQGAGRVDPYKAIHSTMEFQVKETTPTLTPKGDLSQIKEKTGAMNFGNLSFSGKDILSTRSYIIQNNGSKTKTFDVKVTFQNGVRGSLDASKNGVKLIAPSSIKMNANSKFNGKASLYIPKKAQKGIYEGYITYTNRGNKTETYRVPFAVHYVEEGIQSYFFDYDSTTTAHNHLSTLVFNPTVYGHFTLKSHMRYLYEIITDNEGNELGVTNYGDGMGINEGVQYSTGFDGTYYPFTGDDDNPLSAKFVNAKEGQYKLKMIGFNDAGKAFVSSTAEINIDNTMPDAFDAHLEGEQPNNPFVEYEPGTKSIPFTALVHDNGISGQKVDQSKNYLYYFYNSLQGPTGIYNLDSKGNYQGQVSTDPNGNLVDFELEGIDHAGNTFGRKYNFLVPNNYTYVYGKPNVPMRGSYVFAHKGDSITYTLTANHVKNLKTAAYRFISRNVDTVVTNVSLNPAAAALGATLTYTKTPSSTQVTNNVTVNFDPTNGVNGNIPMVDVTIQIPNTPDYTDSSSMTNAVSSTFTSVSGTVTRPYSWVPPTGILPNFSTVYGMIRPEELLDAKGNLVSRDYTKFGAKVSVVDSEGNTYSGTINNKFGGFTINGLPVTRDDLTFIQDLPGHFTMYSTFNEYRTLDGVDYGDWKTLSYPNDIENATAGDVNKDNVIDIKDALAIQASFGAHAADGNYNRGADINFDGVIDGKDFAYVEENFALQNSTVDNAPAPVKKINGKTLVDIKQELGL
ncbi:S8 family serine peptidase [Gottfriedia acidiceleris]|uniref:S8 family serine peptidase n=1 Tax=Gottfriedia acidiceleris TaxID=371036 RepID=UPI00101BD53B|nr:S8 family serine peptidase [Gottfriedia acidiceleris]